MSSLTESLFDFNLEEIKHYGKGRMGLSIRSVSRIVKIPNSAFGRAIGIFYDKRGDTTINKELSSKLTAVGFPLLPRKEWAETGIPDIAVGVCISHYAHHAKNKDPQVVALAESLVACSVREVLQKRFGYTEDGIAEGNTEVIHQLQNLQTQFDVLQKQTQANNTIISVFSKFAEKTEKSFPGMLTLLIDMCETEEVGNESKHVSLPFLTRFPENFTASNWLDFYAPDFTRRQRVNFCKDLAGLHRDLVDDQPKMRGASYLYNHSHQPLLLRVKESVEKLIIGEGMFVQYNKTNKRLAAEAKKIAAFIEVQPLTHREQSLIGKSMGTTDLAIALGYNVSVNDNSFTSRLAFAVKKQKNSGKIPDTRQYNRYVVTPELIQCIKNWFDEKPAA
ncbi:MAG: hypothetical protein PUP93_27410 [Rhizonema sp. NSF051]|nr:hypothetical protein [Rhizonema sp. NSF051]